MFTQMQGLKVASDEGFTVAVVSLGPDGMAVAYEEHGKDLLLLANLQRSVLDCPDSLLDPNKALLVEVPQTLNWLEPNTLTAVSDRNRILLNIENALNFMKQPFVFVWETHD